MMTVGLTGGIGSGKTTVAGFFRTLGIPVYDSDQEARRLMGSSGKLRSAIRALLGEGAYTGKQLNREFIAGRVFDDPLMLKRLNALVHPEVRKDFLKWKASREAAYVIQEAAIIFENGSQANYDKTILVTAPENIRIARVMRREGSSAETVKARIRNQWKDVEKVAMADFVIDNSDLKKTASAVRAIHSELLKLSG